MPKTESEQHPDWWNPVGYDMNTFRLVGDPPCLWISSEADYLASKYRLQIDEMDRVTVDKKTKPERLWRVALTTKPKPGQEHQSILPFTVPHLRSAFMRTGDASQPGLYHRTGAFLAIPGQTPGGIFTICIYVTPERQDSVEQLIATRSV